MSGHLRQLRLRALYLRNPTNLTNTAHIQKERFYLAVLARFSLPFADAGLGVVNLGCAASARRPALAAGCGAGAYRALRPSAWNMPYGAAFSTGAPIISMYHTRRCICLNKGRLPLAVPVFRDLRGPEVRCSLAAPAAERHNSESTAAPAATASSENGQVDPDAAAAGPLSNGDPNSLERLRSSVVYNVVSQALADGTTRDAQNAPQASTDELSSVRQELASVRELLSVQAELVRQQSHAMKQLQGMVKVQTQKVVNAARPKPEVRPLDAQLAALGDRRYLGMYDARFHSTNK